MHAKQSIHLVCAIILGGATMSCQTQTAPTSTTPVSESTPSSAGMARFDAPSVAQGRIDWCLNWGDDCGKAAADRFCQAKGFSAAARFEQANDIGAMTPTYIQGAAQICRESSCDGFTYIECTR